MAKINYQLRLNADGTLTIVVGRMRESIGLAEKEKAEIYDRVKYALISKDAFISDERLTQDLYDTIWKHVEEG